MKVGGKHTRQCAGTTAEFIVRLVVDSLAVANMCHLAMPQDAGTTDEFIVGVVVDSLAVANMCHLAMPQDAGP